MLIKKKEFLNLTKKVKKLEKKMMFIKKSRVLQFNQYRQSFRTSIDVEYYSEKRFSILIFPEVKKLKLHDFIMKLLVWNISYSFFIFLKYYSQEKCLVSLKKILYMY